MDKRMTALLICGGTIVFGFLLLSCAALFSGVSLINLFSLIAVFFLGGTLLILVGSFFILGMGTIFSVLAFADALSPRKAVNGRYFTRCFLYRVISISFILVCWICHVFIFNKWHYSIFDAEKADDTLGLYYLICLFGILALSIALHVTAAFHVISGLVASHRQKALTDFQFTMHLLAQFFFVLDFISLILLMNWEKKTKPMQRIDVVRNVVAPRPLPIPGVYGVSYIITAAITLLYCAVFLSVGIHSYMIDRRANLIRSSFGHSGFSIFFYSAVLIIGLSAVINAIRYLRKLPAEVTSRPFLKKTVFFAWTALLSEIALSILLGTILFTLMTKYSSITAHERKEAFMSYSIFIALSVVAILLVHLSVFFNMRLIIRRSLADQVISVEDGTRLSILSLIPAAQIVIAYRLIKVNQAQIDCVKSSLC